MKYEREFKFSALVECKIEEVDESGLPYLIEFSHDGIAIASDWFSEEGVDMLIISNDPEKRKLAQQEKIDKLKQQLEEEQAKLEAM